MKHFLGKALATLALCTWAMTSTATKLVHVYTFDNGLDDFASAVTLQDSGGSVESGGYVFDLGQGLSVTSTAFSSQSYSVELQFSIDEFTSVFTKIIDTSNLLDDGGLYVQNGAMRYYPEFRLGPTPINAGESLHVVMTRDEQGLTRIYVNGLFQFSVVTGNSAVIENTLHFFKDDVVTVGENAAGRVDRIRIYDQALTPVQVRALASGGDLLVERDLSSGGDGLITFDLSTNTEWLDLAETVNTSVNDIEADIGGWASEGFLVADRPQFNALWHVVGVSSFNEESTDNFPIVQNFVNLFGCTFFCTSSSPRSSGLYKKFPGTVGSVVGIGEGKLVNGASTGEAVNFGSVTLDRSEDSWGVYLVRDAAVPDFDSDGVNDETDNCVFDANASQTDSDGDGYGNRCDGDLNNDGVVNFLDVSLWAPFFNTASAGPTDLNADGQTNFLDYAILTGFYLQAPGPSAFHEL